MPGDIVHGTSYQIAFNIRQVCDPPLFVAWADGHASRQKARNFDHVEVLGPLAHQKFLLEVVDWQNHIPSYPRFRDVRTEARPTEPIRTENTYVLEPLGAVWKQHTIDDWVEFQGKRSPRQPRLQEPDPRHLWMRECDSSTPFECQTACALQARQRGRNLRTPLSRAKERALQPRHPGPHLLRQRSSCRCLIFGEPRLPTPRLSVVDIALMEPGKPLEAISPSCTSVRTSVLPTLCSFAGFAVPHLFTVSCTGQISQSRPKQLHNTKCICFRH